MIRTGLFYALNEQNIMRSDQLGWASRKVNELYFWFFKSCSVLLCFFIYSKNNVLLNLFQVILYGISYN